MPTLTFSDEATLFSRQYAIVEEVTEAWHRELDRFHEALFVRLRAQFEDLQQKPSVAYRYWWRKSWEGNVGYLCLWSRLHYPDLIRDQTLDLFACFFDNRDVADEAVNSRLQSMSVGIRGLGVELAAGKPNTDRAVALRIPWKVDPGGESPGSHRGRTRFRPDRAGPHAAGTESVATWGVVTTALVLPSPATASDANEVTAL
jgi:hypothetical protein